MAQFARPDADNSNAGGWSPSSGSDLFAMVDESSPDDADYIEKRTSTTADFELGLSTVTDPGSSTDHTIRTRHQRTNTSISYRLDIELRQGATLIASWSHTATDAFTTDTYTLTGTEADAITDYSTLNIYAEAANTTGFGSAFHQISWVELEIPNVAAASHAGTAVNAPTPLKSKLQGLVS